MERSTIPDILIRDLVDVGLSALEAEVYTVLLAQPLSTGYRIGQLLNKPTANVYKALEALAGKGAVLIEDGDARAYRPVPTAEFLDQLQATFQQRKERITARLANAVAAPSDERVYQLQSAPLILERARRMLGHGRTIAVIDAFPHALAALRSQIEQTIARGVAVFVQVYQPTVLAGAQVAHTYHAERILAYWASQQLNVVVDGQEVLLALLNAELTEVHQAIWSQSLYLSSMAHAGMMREQVVHRLMEVQGGEHALEQMRTILAEQQFFYDSDVPGQRALLARFATADAGTVDASHQT
jgi:sugar-specific transcriptional regulator TrmB